VDLGAQGFAAISVVAQNSTGGLPTAADAGVWADGLDLSLIVVADTTGVFWTEWNPEGVLPVTYVVDRSGVVSWADYGDSSVLEELQAHVVELVGD
jgi:hypothetical protein